MIPYEVVTNVTVEVFDDESEPVDRGPSMIGLMLSRINVGDALTYCGLLFTVITAIHIARHCGVVI